MTQFNSAQRRAAAGAKSNVFTVLMLITVINLSIGTGYVLYRFNELYHSFNILDFSTPNAPTGMTKAAAPMPTASAAPAAAPAATPATAPATP